MTTDIDFRTSIYVYSYISHFYNENPTRTIYTIINSTPFITSMFIGILWTKLYITLSLS